VAVSSAVLSNNANLRLDEPPLMVRIDPVMLKPP
jgi:hypothetical protein